MTGFYLMIVVVIVYLLLTLYLTYLVQRLPRNPVKDLPDWGRITDIRIPTEGGGALEVWRIDPQRSPRGIVVLVHGWGRNRDRMVQRAKIFGTLGFSTVIPSCRDHGRSTRCRFMNALRFGEDVEAVLTWINEPVLLYGHSAGAAGSIIAASRHPDQVKLLFLEGCYARTKEALRSLYRNFNLFFGLLFGPVIVFWMDLFYRFQMDGVSPVRLAPNLQMPVLIIHGENDRNFPLHHAKRLLESFVHGNAELFVAEGADHSGSSQAPRFSETIRRFVEQHLPARQHCHDIML